MVTWQHYNTKTLSCSPHTFTIVVTLIATTGCEMTTGPFPCCVMPNFIQDDDSFLDNLKDELLRLKYHDKDNDLYQFHQVCLSVCLCVCYLLARTICVVCEVVKLVKITWIA